MEIMKNLIEDKSNLFVQMVDFWLVDKDEFLLPDDKIDNENVSYGCILLQYCRNGSLVQFLDKIQENDQLF